MGMQMAVIEAARNLLKLEKASSTEFGQTSEPVVALMTEWMDSKTLQKRRASTDMGGTMRLGAFPCTLAEGSEVQKIYNSTQISERHRHRYEVNGAYQGPLRNYGYKFSGMSPDGELPEILEFENHPWFIGVQFHPELKSRPFNPHPLFKSFIKAAIIHSEGK
jgi:CTP synthase